MNRVPTLELTTTGRKTGLASTKTLVYLRDGDSVVVVASDGGAQSHPAWYLDLMADPRVHVRIGGEEHAATAIVVENDAERTRLWRGMLDLWPDAPGYQGGTGQRIPLIRLRPA